MFCNRSHDNYVTGKNGFLEPVQGSKYASQQTVFDDLGQGVLQNAFDGQHLLSLLAVDNKKLCCCRGTARRVLSDVTTKMTFKLTQGHL